MAVDFYDRGVKAKITKVFENTIYQERELVFHTLTDRTGMVKFPLISIFRPDGWTLSSSNNTNVMNREFLNGLRQIYVDLKYQIDIWANTREDLEQLTAELVLYLSRNPSVEVVYTSTDSGKTKSVTEKGSLVYVSGPERTSELEDANKGRIYRYTLVYSLANVAILAFQPTELNPDGTKPDGYATYVTQVLVDVIPEVSINSVGDGTMTIYRDKEKNI